MMISAVRGALFKDCIGDWATFVNHHISNGAQPKQIILIKNVGHDSWCRGKEDAISTCCGAWILLDAVTDRVEERLSISASVRWHDRKNQCRGMLRIVIDRVRSRH